MSNQPNIILKNCESSVPTVWLLEPYLCSLIDEITEGYLRTKCRYKYKSSVPPSQQGYNILPKIEGKAYRWGKIDGAIYYDYDHIPNKAPTFYQSKLPTKDELIAIARAAEQEAAHKPVRQFLTEYVRKHWKAFVPAYGDCTKLQQGELARAAAFLEGAINYFKDNITKGGKLSYCQTVGGIAEAEELQYFPKNHLMVGRKMDEFLNENKSIIDIIKLPREGNGNSAKFINDEIVQSWVVTLRSAGENFTLSHIIREVWRMCDLHEREKPSERWIGNYVNQPDVRIMTAEGRWGAKGRYGQRYRGYTPMAGALFAGDCWQMDGSRVNLLDFGYTYASDKGTVTKRVFLYIVVVRDVHSGVILGQSFGVAEDRWMYINALEMAVQTAGYLPFEITTDRFPGHNTQEAKELISNLEGYGVKMSIVHTAEGKPQVERWFGTLQTVFMQRSTYYYGEGITSGRKTAHRSKEYLKKAAAIAKEEGWDYDKASDEANKILIMYNSTPLNVYSRKHKGVDMSPEMMHTTSTKPHVIDVAAWQQAYLFGIRKELRVSNMGLLCHELQHKKYFYRVDSFDTMSKNEKLLCCFSIDDLETLHLYPAVSDSALRPYLGVAKRIKDVSQFGPHAFEGIGDDTAKIAEFEQKIDERRQLAMVPGGESMALLQGGSVPKAVFEEADRKMTLTKVMGVEVSGDDDDFVDFNVGEAFKRGL